MVVRGTLGGKRVNWGLERAKREGLDGTFWIRWNNGNSQKWGGPHKDEWAARAAKVRKERELKQIALGLPVADSGKRITLSEAIARFLEVKRIESQDGRSADRWKWELELFQQVTGKTYVDEIVKEDSYKYWRHYQDRKREPRTIYNRLCSINRFLSDSICSVAADRRLSVKEMPVYDESAVDYYSQEDLKRLFAACNAEERLAYQFFLYSGSNSYLWKFRRPDNYPLFPSRCRNFRRPHMAEVRLSRWTNNLLSKLRFAPGLRRTSSGHCRATLRNVAQ
jgi:hypothetical protein